MSSSRQTTSPIGSVIGCIPIIPLPPREIKVLLLDTFGEARYILNMFLLQVEIYIAFYYKKFNVD